MRLRYRHLAVPAESVSQKFLSTQYRASLRHFCVTRLDLALLSIRVSSLN